MQKQLRALPALVRSISSMASHIIDRTEPPKIARQDAPCRCAPRRKPVTRVVLRERLYEGALAPHHPLAHDFRYSPKQQRKAVSSQPDRLGDPRRAAHAAPRQVLLTRPPSLNS